MPASHRYYSANNEYQAEFPFMVEPNASIPLSADFWDFIMSQGASWGLCVTAAVGSSTNTQRCGPACTQSH